VLAKISKFSIPDGHLLGPLLWSGSASQKHVETRFEQTFGHPKKNRFDLESALQFCCLSCTYQRPTSSNDPMLWYAPSSSNFPTNIPSRSDIERPFVSTRVLSQFFVGECHQRLQDGIYGKGRMMSISLSNCFRSFTVLLNIASLIRFQ
jgi:hypothetical protein